jgi:hypothetical protein
MSGKIELKVRKGFSKDRRYNYYPEAYMLVTGEDGVIVSISPRYADLMKLLMEFRMHELKIDLTRKRIGQASSLIAHIGRLLVDIGEARLNEYSQIEPIYTEQEMKDDKESSDIKS